MLVHGTEESKPLQCETCFKRFLNNSALACHVKIHTGKATKDIATHCKETSHETFAKLIKSN